MIKEFAISNFKNLAQLPADPTKRIQFGPLNVLIGPNGCGKSSMLQAIDFLRAFFLSSVEVYLTERGWNYLDLPNLRQSSKTIRWRLVAELDAGDDNKGAGTYEYSVTLQPRKHLGVGEESLRWTPPNGTPQDLLRREGRSCEFLNSQTGEWERREIISLPASVLSRWDVHDDRLKYPEMLRFRKWVEGFRQYLIWDPKVLRNPDRGKHDEIGPSGEHLASVLGRLRDRNRPAFDRLVQRLKHLFPTVTDVSVSGRGGWGWRMIRLHEGNGKQIVFSSQQMSDGVLRLLAVTSLLYLDRIPSLITFEEPENGVHPQLIREIVQILRELTQRKPPNRCQVFLTTHSPSVLDEFFDYPQGVYCMDRREPQAGATIIRLSENKQLKLARDTFDKALGEAWTSGLIGATAGKRAR